jgi:predicted RNase H-like nuclease
MSSTSSQVSLQQIKDEVEYLQRKRDECLVVFESLINTMNESTYYTDKLTHDRLSVFMQSSTLSAGLEDAVFEKIEKVATCREKIMSSVARLAETLEVLKQLQCSAEPAIVNVETMQRFVQNARKQCALEDLAFARLKEMSEQSLDQDLLVMLLSCYKLSPYFHRQDVDLLLSC